MNKTKSTLASGRRVKANDIFSSFEGTSSVWFKPLITGKPFRGSGKVTTLVILGVWTGPYLCGGHEGKRVLWKEWGLYTEESWGQCLIPSAANRCPQLVGNCSEPNFPLVYSRVHNVYPVEIMCEKAPRTVAGACGWCCRRANTIVWALC